MITKNNYETTLCRHEYDSCNISNALITDNTVYINENTKVECNNGERFYLEEYIKKQLNCNNVKSEEKKNNLTFHNKLSNKLNMLI